MAGREGWSVVRPRSREIGPAQALCRLSSRIHGTDDEVEPNRWVRYLVEWAYRLRECDGTTDEVARTEFGLTCDGSDFLFQRNRIDPDGCKHIRAMVAYGRFWKARRKGIQE